MNTPAHALLNLLVLGKRERSDTVAPITVGALLPDVPMFVFYAWQKLLGTPEHVIWRERYYDPGWQAAIDSLHSLPLIALAALIARIAGWRWLLWMCASMALHAVSDLGTHHDDAHRHFFPFSDWQFMSPVSYWDPAHYGRIVSMLELALCAFSTAWLWHRYAGNGARLVVCLLASAYAARWAFVFT